MGWDPQHLWTSFANLHSQGQTPLFHTVPPKSRKSSVSHLLSKTCMFFLKCSQHLDRYWGSELTPVQWPNPVKRFLNILILLCHTSIQVLAMSYRPCWYFPDQESFAECLSSGQDLLCTSVHRSDLSCEEVFFLQHEHKTSKSHVALTWGDRGQEKSIQRSQERGSPFRHGWN